MLGCGLCDPCRFHLRYLRGSHLQRKRAYHERISCPCIQMKTFLLSAFSSTGKEHDRDQAEQR